jgi:hypothetical protein
MKWSRPRKIRYVEMKAPKNRHSDPRKSHISSFRLSRPVFVSRCPGAIVCTAKVSPPMAYSAGSVAGSSAQPGLAGQVWVADPGGRLRAVPLRLGITDGIVTEVLEGVLGDQQDVVVGMTAAATQPAVRSSGPRLGL